MEIKEIRLEGRVSLEITDFIVKLFWITDVKGSSRSRFKGNLLQVFAGRLIIDFRWQDQSIVRNDTVCVLDVEMDFDTFVVDLIHEHDHFLGNTVSWTDPTKQYCM